MLKINFLGNRTLPELAKDEEGASMVEYSVLIGLITVAAIVAITAVGGWVADQWTQLQTTIGA